MYIDGPPYLMYNTGPTIGSIHDLQVKIVWVQGYTLVFWSINLHQLPVAFPISNVGPGLYTSWVHASTPVAFIISNVGPGLYTSWVHQSTPVTYFIPNIKCGSRLVHQLGPCFYTSYLLHSQYQMWGLGRQVEFKNVSINVKSNKIEQCSFTSKQLSET